MPGAAKNAKVALEEQVPIVNVSLGKAEWIADGLSNYGGKLLATVTNQKHAQAALETGADALMVTGHEAAANGGSVTSLVLVPSMRQDFPDIPMIAVGGFANGRGLAAALALIILDWMDSQAPLTGMGMGVKAAQFIWDPERQAMLIRTR